MSKKFLGLIAIGLGLVAVAVILQNSIGTASFIWKISEGGVWLLPLVGVAALIDSINPCAFSILILTIAFLFSVGKLRSGVLKIGGAYIAGIFAAYMLIGLGLLEILHIFNAPHFMAKVGSVLLIALGAINIINDLFPSFPIKLRIPRAAHQKIGTFMERASVPTALALGVLVGLCEFPCTGGPYLMILGLLHDNATFFPGLGYLLLYNFIFVLPLLVILFIASDRKLLDKVQEWRKSEVKRIHLWSGIAMIILGVLILVI